MQTTPLLFVKKLSNSLEHRFMSVESFNFPLLIITYSQNLKTSLCIKEKFLSLFRNKMLTGNLPRRQLFCKFLCFRPMAIDYAAITKWKMSWFIIVKKTLLNLYFIHFKRLNKTNYFCYMCMQLTYPDSNGLWWRHRLNWFTLVTL